jgi:hypothetical protein
VGARVFDLSGFVRVETATQLGLDLDGRVSAVCEGTT